MTSAVTKHVTLTFRLNSITQLYVLNFISTRIQEERSERHKYKNVLRERGAPGLEPVMDMIPDIGSYDTGDPNTTNLYLGNLNPKVSGQLHLAS